MKIGGLEIALDLNQIQLLAALGELNSVSAAAGRIGLSQSAASHALAKLRQQLGDRLFVRTSAGLMPTPYGEGLAKAARDALDTLRVGLEGNRPFDPKSSTRTFSVYMSDIGQLVFLPRLLARLGVDAPGVRLHVWPIPAIQPHAALESGDVDLAVGFFTTLTSGFRQRLLFKEDYVCVSRADHPRFTRGMSLDAFRSAPQVVTTSSGAGHHQLERALARHRSVGGVALAVPQFVVIPLLIANSDLLAVIPSQLAEVFAKQIPIKVMPPPVRLPSYDIRIFWHERFHNDPASRWVREMLIELFQRRSA